jgi:hypothetical protein
MLTAIQIGYFKAFAESQRIPIRPLALIYGANSSGKSSVLHSLVLARHAMETGELDVHRTALGGESVDLGGFQQYVHKRDINKRVEFSAEINTAAFSGKLAELLAAVKDIAMTVGIGLPQIEEMAERESIDPRTGKTISIKVPTGNMIVSGIPEVNSYSIHGDGSLLIQMSKRRDGKLHLDRLDHEHPVFREVIKAMVMMSTTTETIHPEDYEGLDEAIAELVPEMAAVCSRLFPEGLAESTVFSPGGQPRLFTISKARRKEDLNAALRSFLPRKIDELLKGINQAVTDDLSRLKYLGPLRSYPPRHLAFSQHHDPNWYAGGGYAWDVVRRDANVRKLVNQWLIAKDRLQTRYQLQVNKLLSADAVFDHVSGGIEAHVDSLDEFYAEIYEDGLPIGDSDLVVASEKLNPDDFRKAIAEALEKISKGETLEELVLVDKRSDTIVSHRDVGIGVSQVLPVLVAAYASQSEIIAIEQPEIHLHPALQADLGDVFIQSVMGPAKNRFLIETHSEHLLLRIMRRIRETNKGILPDGIPPIRPTDICVLFVEPDGSRSIVREMPLDENGELVSAWPGGFFEEDFKELF